MAPAKGNKPEINSWGWIVNVKHDEVTIEHIKKAYRITEYKPCQDRRRNCKKNPYCCWGLGEKKWVQDPDEETEEDDYGFREEGEFAGLQNLGATCYVNSLLQLWFHNPILRPAILRWQPSHTIDYENYRPKCAIAQLQAMFARMKVSKRSKIDPTEFVTSLKLDTGEQQDAQEFSKLFMEVIVKLLTEYADGEIRNSVATAFRGELQNETECLGCNNKTRRQESFSELELGVRKNLSESLDELLKDETLSGSEQYFCSVCQMKNDAIRRTQLLKLPPVMNLQLMRFVFDRETYRKKKVTTSIQFPEVLDMTSRIYKSDSREMPEQRIYQLTAVLDHHGPSASSGHYIAQVKDLRTSAWHTFNDENVGKSKSQKLILKDDEAGSGSDTDKKGKSKKPKQSSAGIHSSQRTYMLVYTLDEYVKNPEPDPELWPYLDKLVQTEDQSYEEELKKSKNDKDYENGLRDQRRQEIAMLYPTLQVTDKINQINSHVESEDSDFQPPKRKQPRSETTNGNLLKPLSNTSSPNANKDVLTELEANKDTNNQIPVISLKPERSEEECPIIISSINNKNEEHLVSNGYTSSVKAEDDFDMDFISTDWLQQWLDSNNPPPPIENYGLGCEHGKLSPPAPNATSCLYRIVPSEFADLLYANYNYVGTRFRGLSSLCEICVQRECRRLRMLQELEDDNKRFLELNRKSDNAIQMYNKNGVDLPLEFLEDMCWIGKDVCKNWKRLAKKGFENKKNSDVDEPAGSITDLNELEMDCCDCSTFPLNSDIKCIHNNLDPNDAARKLIYFDAWTIILKYFPEAVLMPASTTVSTVSCLDCVNQKKENHVLVNSYKEVAGKQKMKLLDLYHSRNRPDIDKRGSFYVISQNFLNEWKKFIRDPSRYPPVHSIKNQQLLCHHNLFKYPFMYLADIFYASRQFGPEEEILCLIHPSEWIFIQENFIIDHQIEVTVLIPNSKDGLHYDPIVCDECALEWWLAAWKKKFEYENEPIYVIKRDTKSPDCTSDNEEDDLFIPVTTTLKRERKIHDPSAWRTEPPWASGSDSLNTAAVRRSNRPRRQKGEKMYKVSSTLKLKDLKVMILRDFKAMPSDQHLFFNNRELSDGSLSLAELEILPDTKLYLKIDKAAKAEDEPISTIPETGFQGTLLMGDSPSQDPSLLQLLEEGRALSSTME